MSQENKRNPLEKNFSEIYESWSYRKRQAMQNFMDSMEELQKAFDQEGGMMVATVFITKIEEDHAIEQGVSVVASPEKEVPGLLQNFYKFVEHRTEKHLPIPIIPYVLFNTNHPIEAVLSSLASHIKRGDRPSIDKLIDALPADDPDLVPAILAALPVDNSCPNPACLACYTASRIRDIPKKHGIHNVQKPGEC